MVGQNLNLQVLVAAGAAALGLVGAELIDRDADGQAEAAAAADGLIEDGAAAAEAGVHEGLVLGRIELGAGEGAEGGATVGEVGAGMLRNHRQRERMGGRPGGIGRGVHHDKLRIMN